MSNKALKNELVIEKTKENVLKRWNSYIKSKFNTAMVFEQYKIFMHKINEEFSYYNLADDYYGYDLEFAIFDKKDNLIFTTNDEKKIYFFEEYLLDPNIYKDKFDNYINKIENRVDSFEDLDECQELIDFTR
ncbi:MAG: hypothetical protein EIB84_06005 [Spiroplasma poulsonii]|uniref:Uncharacterized protein n=1 Tax=Spiroplasma poulsonii TaxID=2138 RepID=A0A2P6FDU1_9MOLU|nr:hypothetical protein [Spiroplasma poulsonii]KAF0850615.1 hypothetical protein MSROBK_014990 [Spiroplasma poulsonii]MBW1242319.1 hypothetical protein [Spiroplasma poulsonii]PQM31627.1 hypothetical protein SMSRO_SF014720 [Spiroplasma poulsonii]PWF96651.1 hypothetical protein SMSE_20980 [Spiroplasma poulsonii]PWF97227.1 hypothetical protein SMH99_20360 [Spiroplasma poulsonii]